MTTRTAGIRAALAAVVAAALCGARDARAATIAIAKGRGNGSEVTADMGKVWRASMGDELTVESDDGEPLPPEPCLFAGDSKVATGKVKDHVARFALDPATLSAIRTSSDKELKLSPCSDSNKTTVVVWPAANRRICSTPEVTDPNDPGNCSTRIVGDDSAIVHLELSANGCPDDRSATLEVGEKSFAEGACIDDKAHFWLDKEQRAKFETSGATRVSAKWGTTTVEFVPASRAAQSAAKGEGAKPEPPQQSDKPTLVPTDVPPLACVASVKTPCDSPDTDDKKIIDLNENLSVRKAPSYVTSRDQVTIRFHSRVALACRYFAESDKSNKQEVTPFVLGGKADFGVIGKFALVSTEGEKESHWSCGCRLKREGEQFVIVEGEKQTGTGETCTNWTTVDFTFGPYSNDQLAFKVVRKSRALSAVDLTANLTVANRPRYNGWFEVLFLGVATPGQDASIVTSRGGTLRRVSLTEGFTVQDFDIAVGAKVFVACTGKGNSGLFSDYDIRAAEACLSLSTAFSATDILERFHPIGLSLTLGRYFSLNGFYTIEKQSRIVGDYANGDLTTEDSLATRDAWVHGLSFGVGLDPTIVVDLVKGLITGH